MTAAQILDFQKALAERKSRKFTPPAGWELQTFPPGEYDLRRLVYEAHPEKAGFKLENLSVYSHPHMPLGDYVYVFENSGKAYVYNEDCQLREYIP